MIYFITQEDDKYVKIGFTETDIDAHRRLIQLQIGNPHKMM